ncbi:hypothetical protein JCM10207_002032 [Rhodosporidiobolus poonsookiae]
MVAPSSSTVHSPLTAALLASALSDFLLSRTPDYPSYLSLPLRGLVWLVVAGWGASATARCGWRTATTTGKGRAARWLWAVAAANAASDAARVRAARWNRSWVWVGLQAYVPLALACIDQFGFSGSTATQPDPNHIEEAALYDLSRDAGTDKASARDDAGDMSPRSSISSAAPFLFSSTSSPSALLVPPSVFLLPLLVGVELWLTDLASARGVALAVVLVAIEAARWTARTTLLSIIVYTVVHLVAPDNHLALPHTPTDWLSLLAREVLGVASLVALQVAATVAPDSAAWANSDGTIASSQSATTFFAGKNALVVLLVSLTGQESSSSRAVRVLLFVTHAAVALPALLRQHDTVATRLPPTFARFSSSAASFASPLSTSSHLSNSQGRLVLATVLPLFLWFLTLLLPPCTLNLPFTPSTCHTVDLVIAHYDRSLDVVREHIALLKTQPLLAAAGTETRVVFYHKSSMSDAELLHGLGGALDLSRGDEIVHLPNYGREGSTYLHHLTRRYSPSLTLSPSPSPRDKPLPHLADTTLLLQSHLAYDWIAAHRLRFALSRRTGFLSFGPYLTTLCGADSHINGEYGGVKTVFREVEGRECREGDETERRLSTYAGQVAVSRSQVLKNPKEVYEHLLEWIELPDDDPIHHEWNPSGPSSRLDPAAGHALERSWPIVFRCDDPATAVRCSEDGIEADGCASHGVPPPPRLPSAPVLVAVLVVCSALADFILTRYAIQATHIVLVLPIASWAIHFALIQAGRRLLDGVETAREVDRRGRRSSRMWALAALSVASGTVKIYAARWNRSWVWLAIESAYEAIALSEPGDEYTDWDSRASLETTSRFSTSSSTDSRPHSPVPSPTSSHSLPIFVLPAAIGAELWLTDFANAWGLLLALIYVGLEAVKVRLGSDEGHDGDVEEALESLSGVSWRAAFLHLVFYAFHFAFGLWDPHMFHTRHFDRASMAAWAFLSAGAATAFHLLAASQLSSSPCDTQRTSLSPSGISTFISAKNALVLLLTANSGQELALTQPVRSLLSITYLSALAISAYDYVDAHGSSAVGLPIVLPSLPPKITLDPPSPPSYRQGPALYTPSSRSSSNTHPFWTVLSFLPLLLWFFPLLFPPCRTGFFSDSRCPTVDIVISYHDRSLSSVARYIQHLKGFPLLAAANTETRVVFYHKGDLSNDDLQRGLSGAVDVSRGDEILHLPNYGREGATYLRHILSRYSASRSIPFPPPPRHRPLPHLADHTLLVQPHMAWDAILTRHLFFALNRQTGYLSLGPYLTVRRCEEDSTESGAYPSWRKIFGLFEGRECSQDAEEDERLATWAGQMVVSKRAVMENLRSVYQQLLEWIEAPDDDPNHHDWNPTGQSTQVNPAFGHSLERGWPLIFHCADPAMADVCGREVIATEACQCTAEAE